MGSHSATTRREALRRLGRGDPPRDVSDALAVPLHTLRHWAREAKLPPRSRAHEVLFGPQVRARAVRLYQAGVKVRTISARTGACAGSIRQWVRDAGHPLRATHTNARLDTQQVVELAAQVGPAAAARSLGCSVASVHYHRQRALVLRVRAELRGQHG